MIAGFLTDFNDWTFMAFDKSENVHKSRHAPKPFKCVHSSDESEFRCLCLFKSRFFIDLSSPTHEVRAEQ